MKRISTPHPRMVRPKFRPMVLPLEDRLMPGDTLGGLLSTPPKCLPL